MGREERGSGEELSEQPQDNPGAYAHSKLTFEDTLSFVFRSGNSASVQSDGYACDCDPRHRGLGLNPWFT